MQSITFLKKHKIQLKHFLLWIAYSLPVALTTGSLVALFLYLLDWAVFCQLHYPFLLFLLPFAGLLIHYLYQFWGRASEKGNNLILEAAHRPGIVIPWIMAPLVLLSTLITHLFGGSAGREGTAVQMGGSIAGVLSRSIKANKQGTQVMLLLGIAAGFGAVFGTPLTGALFAIEVYSLRKMHLKLLLPCLLSAYLAHIVCISWGVKHIHFPIRSEALLAYSFFPSNLYLLVKIAFAGFVFGCASRLFLGFSGIIKNFSKQYLCYEWMRPALGGCVLIALTYILGTRDYLGLGVVSPNPNAVTILSVFENGKAGPLSWLGKLIFTALTLSLGYKGGEVTPLFYIGATLGVAIAPFLGLPWDLMAGLGLLAVFAGATNAPLACVLMGVELFGTEYLGYYMLVCLCSYYCSRKVGMYPSQLLLLPKFPYKNKKR